MMDCALMANPVSTFQDVPLSEAKDVSSSPSLLDDSSSMGDEHIYTNVAEMAEINNRPSPPTPSEGDTPLRSLNGGWNEYHTQGGRSYFYHAETGRCQWNPPRFLRSPSQVQAFLAANGAHSGISSSEGTRVQSTSTDTSPLLPIKSSDVTRDRRSLKCVPVPQVPILPSLSTSYSASFSTSHSHTRSATLDRIPDRPRVEEEEGVESVVDTLDTVIPPSLSSSLPPSLPVHSSDDPPPFTPKSASFDETSFEPPAHLRTIRCGNMEKALDMAKKKEWTTAFMYLTTAHLIIYKDEKSAEKHGKHYAAPLGVCDLKGATIAFVQRERKKRKILELVLSTGSRIFLRCSSDTETDDWFDSLRDVIKKLPAGNGVGLLDHSSALVRTSSLAVRSTMTESQVETSPSKESVIERLIRFFRTRPSVEQLKQKGIYKHEAVFGSTLASISAQEGGSLVPKIILTVTDLIEKHGIDTDGIYRVSGNLSAIQKIRCAVDQDKYSLLSNETDVHVLSGCLKLFFRELSESVFPPSSTKDFIAAVKATGKARLKKFDELLKELPNENRETLKHLFKHLMKVASHSAQNRMQIHNLAIVFGPTLFSNEEGKPIGKKGDKKSTGKENKREESRPTVQSNSHLAYNLIMQGQVVEILLTEQNKLESLKGPVVLHL